MPLNIPKPELIHVNDEDLATTNDLTQLYGSLGNTVRYNAGADSDIRNRLNKARNTFRILNVYLEITPVQHKDQIKNVPELFTINDAIRLRMLEDDGEYLN